MSPGWSGTGYVQPMRPGVVGAFYHQKKEEETNMTKPLFIYCDFETTGLSPEDHRPIQVALWEVGAPRDSALEILLRPTEDTLPWSLFAHKMHMENGLLEEYTNSCIHNQVPTYLEADLQLSQYVGLRMENTKQKVYIVGNTVSFDLGFMRKYLPLTAALFAHRVLDVTSIGLMFALFQIEVEVPGKQRAHTALADLDETRAQLEAYATFLGSSVKV